MGCGIYQITNIHTLESYIGQAKNITSRWGGHMSRLRTKKHDNNRLQGSFLMYGENAFAFSVLENCTEGELNERETHWINAKKPAFNIAGGPKARIAQRPLWYEWIPGSNCIRAHCYGCDEIIRTSFHRYLNFDVYCPSCRQDEVRLHPGKYDSGQLQVG